MRPPFYSLAAHSLATDGLRAYLRCLKRLVAFRRSARLPERREHGRRPTRKAVVESKGGWLYAYHGPRSFTRRYRTKFGQFAAKPLSWRHSGRHHG